MKDKPAILLIGPLPNIQANKTGGAQVSFAYLGEYLKAIGYPCFIINTRPFEKGWQKLLNPISLINKFLLYIFKVDIVWVNVSQNGTKYVAPVLFLLTKLLGRKFVFRPFGSSIKEAYQQYPPILKKIFERTVLKSDLIFFQTHDLQKYFSQTGVKTAYLPTSRNKPAPHLIKKGESFNRRFVFMGHLKETKGVDLILEAIKQLGPDYEIHLYGSINEPKYQHLKDQNHSAYKGLLQKEAVISTLANYDVLLLPTFYEGEGYPGAIIEAYSLGLPVIASDWRAIPEIVMSNQTGLLVEPRSVESLVQAMKSFDELDYELLSKNAQTYFEQNFEASQVTDQALNTVKTLL